MGRTLLCVGAQPCLLAPQRVVVGGAEKITNLTELFPISGLLRHTFTWISIPARHCVPEFFTCLVDVESLNLPRGL